MGGKWHRRGGMGGQIKDMGRGGVGREGGYMGRKVEQSVCVAG